MSDLYAYLGDLGGAEYDWLGHFRDSEYLCAGHNELPMEQQIEAGDIPAIQKGGYQQSDLPDSSGLNEPGTQGGSSGLGKGVSPQVGGGHRSLLGGAIGGAAVQTVGDELGITGAPAEDIGSTFAQNLTEQGPVGKVLGGLLGGG